MRPPHMGHSGNVPSGERAQVHAGAAASVAGAAASGVGVVGGRPLSVRIGGMVGVEADTAVD